MWLGDIIDRKHEHYTKLYTGSILQLLRWKECYKRPADFARNKLNVLSSGWGCVTGFHFRQLEQHFLQHKWKSAIWLLLQAFPQLLNLVPVGSEEISNMHTLLMGLLNLGFLRRDYNLCLHETNDPPKINYQPRV